MVTNTVYVSARFYPIQFSVYYVCGIAVCLQHPWEKLELKSALKEVVNALNWVHSIVGVQSPIHSPLVPAMTKGLGRLMDRPVQKKTPYPMSVKIQSEIVEKAKAKPLLLNIQLATVSLLAFFGLLHCDKLLHLYIKAAEEIMTVKILL